MPDLEPAITPNPHRDAVAAFQALFPGFYVIKYSGLDDDGSKKVIRWPGQLDEPEAQRHLLGHATYGLAPGYPVVKEDERKRWECLWLCLDFDRTPYADLDRFTEWLEREGLFPYLTTGTTGRGAHVYLFLERPLAVPTAARAAALIADRAKEMGLERPETFPSAMFSAGKSVFLPYRAGLTGKPVNPLRFPGGGALPYRPIPLESAHVLVERCAPETLAQMVPARPKAPRPAPASSGALERLREAVQQAGREFAEGKQQHLMMALAGLAVHLGLPQGQAAVEMRPLVEASPAPERKRRLGAIENTYKKAAEGQHVAFKPFYDRAGVAAPPRAGQLPKAAVEALKARRTPNRTMQPIHDAFAAVAEAFGWLEGEALHVSVSNRDLAARSGLSETQVRRYLASMGIRSGEGTSRRAGVKVVGLGAILSAAPPGHPAPTPETLGKVKNAPSYLEAIPAQARLRVEAWRRGGKVEQILPPRSNWKHRNRVLSEIKTHGEAIEGFLGPEDYRRFTDQVARELKRQAQRRARTSRLASRRYRSHADRRAEEARGGAQKPAQDGRTPTYPRTLAPAVQPDSPPPPANAPPEGGDDG